jgi:fatty-acyl-CoA synthase
VTLSTSWWPADTSEPVLETTVGAVLRAAAERAPDHPALVEGIADPARRRWTYGELLASAERVARALLTRVAPGERVAIWAANSPEWVLVEYGAGLAGVVLVTVNPALTVPEARYVLAQSRVAVVLHDDEFRGQSLAAAMATIGPELPHLRSATSLAAFFAGLDDVDQAQPLPDVMPDDAAQIQSTSGTTGFPKGAVLRHRSITNVARLAFARGGVAPGAVYLTPLPLFHTAGCCFGILGPASTGGTVVVVSAFDPAITLQLVEEERAVALGAVPTVITALLAHPDLAGRTGGLTTLLGGGAPVQPALIKRMEAGFGASFINMFGQTELAPVVTMVRPDDSPEDKSVTVGTPLPQIECRIVDPVTGDVTAIGDQGEMCVRGFSTMIGYFDMPEATAATLDPNGWLHTGDLCTMDERGYVTVTGRLKDMIIRGGENVYPVEVEGAILAHPAVVDAAVVGRLDDHWGESVTAVVRVDAAAPPPTVDELHAWCRDRLARHKIPTQWFVTDEFPLTGSGKVQKFLLRDQLGTGALTPLPATEEVR